MAEIKKRFSKRKNKYTFTASIRKKGYPSIVKTFDRITDAKDWVAKTETDIKRGMTLSDIEAQKHTLNELIDRYIKTELPKRNSDIAKFKMQLNWWKNKIGAYYLSSITTPLLTEYREVLESEPSPKPKKGRKTRSNATINRYMAALSVVLSTGVRDWGWLRENPMFNVRKEKEDNSRIRFLTKQEVATLLIECKKSSFHLYLLVLIALSTGARYSEILNLKWENVDLNNQLFSFMGTKNGDNRGVPITDKLCEILKEHKKNSLRHIKNDFVFSNEKGDAPINRKKAFRNAVKKSKLEDFHFHDLRHTAASYLAMSGKSITEIAEILGHKTLQMVKRYSHLTKGHTKNVLEDMNVSLFSEVKDF